MQFCIQNYHNKISFEDYIYLPKQVFTIAIQLILIFIELMQRYLIKSTQQPKYNILLRHVQTYFEITVIIPSNKQYFYRQTLNNNVLPESLEIFFQTTKQLFDHLKSQKPQNIHFLTTKADSQIGSSLLPNWRVQFQVQAANKMIKRSLKLNEYQATQITYNLILKQIQDIQKVQEVKKRLEQKRNKIKTLENNLTLKEIQILNQDQQINQAQTLIKKINSQIKAKQEEIAQIRKEYQIKNKGFIIKDKKIEESKPNGQKDLQGQILSASKIYEAMPKSCEMHPFGKHIEFHSGRKTLFLKSKNITDSDIQGMMTYNWEQIQILSLGGNKLTNRSLQVLGQISDWKNVTHLYLFSNQITDITKIKFLGNLEILSLYELELNQASCDHLIKTQFPNLEQIYLNFAPSCMQKCWKKLAQSGLKNFPKLKTLSVDKFVRLSVETRVKLNQLCLQKNIKLQCANPSQNCIIF